MCVGGELGGRVLRPGHVTRTGFELLIFPSVLWQMLGLQACSIVLSESRLFPSLPPLFIIRVLLLLLCVGARVSTLLSLRLCKPNGQPQVSFLLEYWPPHWLGTL